MEMATSYIGLKFLFGPGLIGVSLSPAVCFVSWDKWRAYSPFVCSFLAVFVSPPTP